MIVISYIRDDEQIIRNFEMSGHAEWANHGSDIVCAAASTIVQTTLKAIKKFSKENFIDFSEDDNYLKVIAKDDSCEIVQLLLENMIETYEELASQFPNNIKMKNRGVL